MKGRAPCHFMSSGLAFQLFSSLKDTLLLPTKFPRVFGEVSKHEAHEILKP